MAQDLLESRDETDLWEEELWSVLLEHVEERGIIPIVGRDLLQVEVNGKLVLLDRYIAGQLARKYSMPIDEEMSLNDTVCALLHRGKQREILSSAVHKILAEAGFAPPRPLLQLAEITHFDLFVTTTFDLFLEDAIKKVRNVQPKTIAYTPYEINNDISTADLLSPTVYHLFGKSCALPKYVISEEDMLEFVHALQSESHRPHLLFDELKHKNLLVLGEHFPDWLGRFFLRTAKQGRLSETRRVTEFLADSQLQSDKNLVLFLQRFSKNTRIFRGASPIEFVDELWRRWRQKNAKPITAPVASGDLSDELPAGAIFISYAHEDLSAVQNLSAGLIKEGMKVWFDQSALKAADRFDFKIQAYIEEQCSCFLMVMSQNTEKRLEGYFRKEWDHAIGRCQRTAHTVSFLVPIVIDDTAPKDLKTMRPEAKKYTITSLPGGDITPEFASRIKSIVAKFNPS